MKLVPPQSKSDAQRALILSDITGAPIELESPAPRDVEVLSAGLHAVRSGPTPTIDCHDGGAPFRFLLGQAAVTPNRVTTFTGTSRLGERPHAPLLEALRSGIPGLEITEGNPWPLIVRSPQRLDAVHFEVDAKLSSQFASSLLLAAARVTHATKQKCTVKIAPGMTSEGYFKLTLRWLSFFGFKRDEANGVIELAHVRAPHADLEIPGDWSSLGYLLVLSWLSKLPVARVQLGSGHPDEVVLDYLSSAGLLLDEHDVVQGKLKRGFEEVDASFAPDSVPTLAAMATRLATPSRFVNTAILRAKESDRLEATQRLLTAAGLRSELIGDTLTVQPGNIASDFDFDARDDHRMAMTAAVLARLHGKRVKLIGAESVAKSFPNFWAEARKAGVELA